MGSQRLLFSKMGEAFGVQEGALGKEGLKLYIEKYGLGDTQDVV